MGTTNQLGGFYLTRKIGLIQDQLGHDEDKEGVLKSFAKFTGKHLRQSLFFNKVAGLSLQLY